MAKKELAIQLLVKEKEELQLIKDQQIEECNRVLCEKNKLENELQKKEEAAQQREKEVRGILASEGNEAGNAGGQGGVNEGGRVGVKQVAHKVLILKVDNTTQTDGATAKPRVS